MEESKREEKVALEKKLKSLRQQKEKLSGSKNKRERAKVNKQISQTLRRLEGLEKEVDRIQKEEEVKAAEEQKKLAKKKVKERQEKEDKSYIQKCEEKHKLKDATVQEIMDRIDSRKSVFKEFHHEEYWNMLIIEQNKTMKSEEGKQTKFLKAHGLTQADMDATVVMIRKRREEEKAKKAAEESEKPKEAESEEAKEEAPTAQTEEIVILSENADEDVPKAFPGYKAENSDEDGPGKLGPSEGPEETCSEKPLEPAVTKSEEPEIVQAEEEVKANAPAVTQTNGETVEIPVDRKNYGSAQYWDDRYEKFADKTEEWYEGWKTLQEVISPFISKDMMIMDFGCGDSFMQDELTKEGFTCFGTDISNVVLQRLAEKPEREMFTADGFAMPLRSNSWDAIIDKGTLDAIACDQERDLTPLFEEIYRILAPGGRYLCVTPWHGEKRLPQLNVVPWEIMHEVMPMSEITLAKQRFNQLKNHPKLGSDRKRLLKMSTRQARQELAALNLEEAKNLPPERSCVIHCYVCQKTSA